MALEEDIYEMYRDGPFDWFNPIDFMTSTLTGGPSGSWSEKTHSEKSSQQTALGRTATQCMASILGPRRTIQPSFQ